MKPQTMRPERQPRPARVAQSKKTERSQVPADPSPTVCAPDVAPPGALAQTAVATDGQRAREAYPAMHRPRWRDYTAFVLSGGGARGALQVGALRALLERGVVPDVIVGTSIGAWNGAWLANDPTLHGVEALAEIWRGLRAEQLLLGYESFRAPTQSIAGILVAMGAAPRLVMGYPSFYTDVGLRRLVRRCVGDLTFADLKATLRIVATDLTHGVRAVFSEGPLEAPILASSAIPAVFPPVRIGDSVYADGCALDSCSIETALSLGARRLFVLSVGYDESEEAGAYWSRTLAPMTPPASAANGQHPPHNQAPNDAAHASQTNHTTSHGMAAIFERITQVMGYYQLSQALTHIPRGVETHVIQLPSHHAGGMLDFDLAGKWMDEAYIFTSGYLDRERADALAEQPAVNQPPIVASQLAS